MTLAYASDAEATIPNVGASGAVSAVLGAYIVLLPRAMVLTIIFVFLREVPAVVLLGFWFLFQLLEGSASLASPQTGGGVAFFAHIGGFVFGVVTIKLVQRHRVVAPRY